MSKTYNQKSAALIIPIVCAVVGILMYYSLGAALADFAGDTIAGYIIIAYALAASVACYWSATQTSGFAKIVAWLSLTLLVLLGIFGAFVVSF